MAFTIRELDYDGAAEVIGLDCSRPLAADVLAVVKEATLAFPILAFRDQHLTPRAQVAFSRQFGRLEPTANSRYAHPDEPLVLILSNEVAADGSPLGIADAGDFLHSDLSPKPEPSSFTILHSQRNPSRGGDTEFVNMYRAYEALPVDVKRQVDGRFAWHHVSKLKNPRVSISGERPDAAEFYARMEEAYPDVLQPVIRTHPETGRPALYVSPRFTLRIDGLDADASEALLQAMFASMQQLAYPYKWRDHDLVMWDNRCLTHRATGGYALPDVRRLHRTSIAGTKAYYDPTASFERTVRHVV